MSTSQKHHSPAQLPDEELAASLRNGSSGEEELAELYSRHRAAVRAYAGTCCRDSHTAEDLTSEVFIRAIDALRANRGPRGPWRPYLLTAVRNLAINWAASNRHTELTEEVGDWIEEGSSTEEFALRNEENDLVVRKIQRLPERWQAVLWHTAVEKEPASRVGPMLGLSESGVASLAERAREGLREAYLSVHVSRGEEDGECIRYSGLLAAAVRRPDRRTSKDFSRHLEGCARCRRAMIDLTDLNSRLRTLLPAAALLWGGTKYLNLQAAAEAAAAALPPVPPHLSGGAKLTVPKSLTAATAALTVGVSAFVLLGPEQSALPQRTSVPSVAAPRTTHSAPQTPAPTVSRAPRVKRRPGGSPSVRPPSSSSAPARPSAPPSAPDKPKGTPYAGPSSTLRSTSTGQCLEVTTNRAGAELREADCDGAARQSWTQLHAEGSRILLRSTASGLCLRNTGSGQASDDQQACDGSDDSQVWQMKFSTAEQSLIVVGNKGRQYEI
ncbi:sigma-70 family RNA polymerase sigma factor [Streptomyces sp. NPDC002659]|uniref:sigma-70 family RNA polymerase sigma factor n=1 Tax=Streptomyces sp. NPDC002659 TaxID=3364656 RepID=UPI0036B62FB6